MILSCVFELIKIENDKYLKKCKKCKFSFWDIDDDLNIIHKCKIKQPNKLLNITIAITKFIAISIWKREVQYVNGEQYKQRLEICNPCDYRHPDKPECNVCGCKLKDFFNKAQLKTEKCPLGKWPILYDADTNSFQVSELSS